MWEKNVETFLGCESTYEDAKIVLFGAPFDSTTSYRPGARFGSSAIRHESYGLETYSPMLDRDLSDIKVFDGGDLELPFGSTEDALSAIEGATDSIFADGKLPVLLGGEHLVTLGAVRSAVRHYPELHLIHFDAHADLRDEYLGVKLSHASVIRRCYDLLGEDKIFQFGIRSGDRAEFRWAAEGHTKLQKFDFEELPGIVSDLAKRKVPVYLTIDLDVLDPSVFPGTGTPEAGGVSFRALHEAMATVLSGADCVGARSGKATETDADIPRLKVVGCDLVELAPTLDPTGASTAVACKMVRELLLMAGA